MSGGQSKFLLASREFGRQVWTKVQADDVFGLAAKMSYYFVLGIFPFLIVMAALVGTLPFTGAWRGVLQWITLYFPRASQVMVFQIVFGLTQGRTGFLSVGLIGTVLAAANGLMSLMEGLNTVYEVPETRGYLKRLGLAVLMIFVLALLLLCTFGLVTAGGRIDRWLAGHSDGIIDAPALWRVTRFLTSAAVAGFGLAILERNMPNLRRIRPRTVPGVAFIVVAWLVSTAGFNFYAEHLASYNKTYGVLGVFVLLMIWIYLSSIIILTGGVINSVLTKMQGRIRANAPSGVAARTSAA